MYCVWNTIVCWFFSTSAGNIRYALALVPGEWSIETHTYLCLWFFRLLLQSLRILLTIVFSTISYWLVCATIKWIPIFQFKLTIRFISIWFYILLSFCWGPTNALLWNCGEWIQNEIGFPLMNGKKNYIKSHQIKQIKQITMLWICLLNKEPIVQLCIDGRISNSQQKNNNLLFINHWP